MKEFFIENYNWMFSALFCILSLIAVILKKVKVNMQDTDFEKVLSLLPSLIIKAEKGLVGGEKKKSFVLSMALTYLCELSGKSIDEVSEIYSRRLDEAIEDILMTPVKKGLDNESKK